MSGVGGQSTLSPAGTPTRSGLDLPDPAVVDQFGHPVEIRLRAEFAVHAKHPARLANGPDQPLALGNRPRDGLFQRDVLARLRRLDRQRHVPMVGRADHHRVDVFAAQHFAIVAVRLAAAVRAGGHLRGIMLLDRAVDLLQTPRIDVANRDHLDVGHLGELRPVLEEQLPAGADQSHRNPLAGRCQQAAAQRRRRHDGRGESHSRARRGRSQETSSCPGTAGHWCSPRYTGSRINV